MIGIHAVEPKEHRVGLEPLNIPAIHRNGIPVAVRPVIARNEHHGAVPFSRLDDPHAIERGRSPCTMAEPFQVLQVSVPLPVLYFD